MATKQVERAVDDRALVLAFQAGDRGAYDVIFRRYGPMTQRICRRYLINPHDAEEATQETMIRVLRSLPTFNGSYALRAWVARIATNLCLDRLRQEGRRSNGEEQTVVFLEHQNGDASSKEDPGEVLERVVRRDEIREHLAQLPEQHRLALVLRDVEGMSHREIAGVLGTTPTKVKALIHRARKGFRMRWNGGERRLGVVLLPVAWAAGWLRRAQGRVQELVTSTTGASPQVATLTTAGGDHMSAAIAAVVLAGSVGLAAGPAPAQPTEKPPAAEAVIVAAPATDRIDTATENERDKRALRATDAPSEETVAVAAEVTAEPETEPSPAADEATPAEQTQLPEPEPVATVRPQPATPAGFTFAFTSDWVAVQPCGCPDQARVVEQALTQESGEPAGFSTRIEGGALRDRSGQPGWQIEVVQSGNRADHTLEFAVHTAAGVHTYSATGVQVGRERTPWGGWTYRYAGSYESTGGPEDSATALPTRGTYAASLTFAVREGRLVDASFSLANGEYGG
jgi:RNA polymerase sigma-70 factor (ECF subfamily)